jgi:hypothetical protein
MSDAAAASSSLRAARALTNMANITQRLHKTPLGASAFVNPCVSYEQYVSWVSLVCLNTSIVVKYSHRIHPPPPPTAAPVL